MEWYIVKTLLTILIKMNDLIQVIKILDQDEVDKLNSHIDMLKFNQSLVFDTEGDLSLIHI